MTTTWETPSAVETTNALLDALDALLPEVAERAIEAERLRTMPRGLVARVEAAGLFRMLRVRAIGGLEVDPPTVVDVVERLAYADASAAWTVLIGATANAFFGWLDPDMAREMLNACPNASSTCVLAPGGAAVPDGSDGFTVSGRWGFNSGIAHSAWRQVGVIVHDADGPRTDESGAPDMRIVFVPAAEGEVRDTWEVMGLRGTGSHDLVLEGVSVPAERMITIASDNRHDGAYARLPLFSL
ncbi:MAG: acyl-CoA dehydrogenase family protein, partial [Pseudonocardiaceae bacterium]